MGHVSLPSFKLVLNPPTDPAIFEELETLAITRWVPLEGLKLETLGK